MALKQIMLVITALLLCAEMGFAFQCLQCSGNMGQCNKMDAKNITCATSQDRCIKVTMSQDGKESGLYGCASKQDCMAAMAACTAVKKNNARAKCMSECCNTTLCNTPPERTDRLKCYTCVSTNSMDDCVQKSVSEYCTSTKEIQWCGKFTTELMMQGKKVMLYRKGCQTEKSCKKEHDFIGSACGSDDTCDFQCCQGDLCNASSFASVSVVSLFACAFLSFLYI